ncbi:MAG: caspase family protein [Burkholderiales bacterium]
MSAWPRRCAVLALAALGLAAAAAEPRRIALLVGVSNYANVEASLDGPVNDVAAMRSVLERRWRFKSADIHTLLDKQATREAILAELRSLQQRSAAGDEVLIYFSGHGASAFSGQAGPPVPHGSGAFVAYDYRDDTPDASQGLIVGRTDLRPLITALDSGGRRLWVISDSCYSGQQVRNLKARGAEPLPTRLIPAPRSRLVSEVSRATDADLATERYPYARTAYLAAAAEGEAARDISSRHLVAFPTFDGKPHGALTDALLRVLEGQLPADVDGDGLLSLNEVHRAVSEFMAQRAYGHTPQRLPSVADDVNALGARSVLSVVGAVAARRDAPTGPLRVGAEGLPESLRKRIAGLPDVLLVAPGTPIDIALRADRSAIAFESAGGDTIAVLPLGGTDAVVGQLRQLAWARRIHVLSLARSRAVLPFEVTPAVFGGNFTIGSRVSFVVRPDREATLLLVEVDASGFVSVLYPFRPAELQKLPAARTQYVPRLPEKIEVQAPEGMDMLFAWAFDDMPAGLERLIGVTRVDAADPRLAGLERLLQTGRFAYARTELRTFAAR